MKIKRIGITAIYLMSYQIFAGSKSCPNDLAKGTPLQMGINLTAPQAESPAIGNAIAFADIFKTARPFESDRADLVKNKNGWPCFNKSGEKIKTNLLQSALPGSVPDGVYAVHYSGDVELNFKGAHFFDCPDGRARTKNGLIRKCLDVQIDHQLNSQGITVEVEAKNKGSCLEDLKVILPTGKINYEAWIENSPKDTIFNLDYIDYLKPFKVLRLMNFMYASPRLPEACRKIQARSIQNNPKAYSWNNLSEAAIECTVDESYNRSAKNRAKLGDASWGVSYNTDKRNWRGVPVEVAAELIKQTGSNPWINIPHNATDEYIELVAKTFAKIKAFNPNLKVLVEYSNEVWNGRFWGAKFIQASTLDPFPESPRKDLLQKLNTLTKKYLLERTAAGSDDKKIKSVTEHYNALMQPYRDKLNAKVEAEVEVYVDQSLRVFKVFEKELGVDSIVRTLGTNQKDPNRTKRMLRILKRRGKLDKVDAIATATYFHGCWGSSKEEGPHCQRYLKESKKQGMYSVDSPEEVLDLLLDEKNPEGVSHVIEQVEKQYEAIKSEEFSGSKIDLIAYEGGQHLTLDNMPADLKRQISSKKKKKLIDLIHRANNHPLMGDIYRKLYEGWAKAGGKLHVNFIMAQSQSQYGSFGMSSHLNNAENSAKYKMAQDFSKRFCTMKYRGEFD